MPPFVADIPKPPYAIVQTVPTLGFSEAARFVLDEWGAIHRSFEEAYSLEANRREVLDALSRQYRECSISGWDGYDAIPVSPSALETAVRFVSALPTGTPMPTVGAEGDGHLTLEWYRSPRRVISISIAPDGNLHFAALLGVQNRRAGTEPFLGEVPQDLLNLILTVAA